MELKIKRIYDEAEPSDGYRILVDKLWPRGMTKQRAHIDLWLRTVAPSDNLRKWFSHQPERFEQFADLYRVELLHDSDLEALRTLIEDKPVVTLVYAAKDTEHNNAVVLREMLDVPTTSDSDGEGEEISLLD